MLWFILVYTHQKLNKIKKNNYGFDLSAKNYRRDACRGHFPIQEEKRYDKVFWILWTLSEGKRIVELFSDINFTDIDNH